MGIKIFSNNMDEPNLEKAAKKNDVEEISSVIKKIDGKVDRLKSLFTEDLGEEDEFANETFDKFHMFYTFVLFQTIVIIFLGLYQVFMIKNKISSQF